MLVLDGSLTMRTKFVSLATLLPMLLHSVLGCCWHHAHSGACDSLPGHFANSESESGDDKSGEHGHQAGCHGHRAVMTEAAPAAADVVCSTDCSSPANEDETPSEPCREDHCVYVASGKIEPPKPFVMSCFDVTSEGTSGLLPLSPVSIHRSNHQGDYSPPTSLSLRARTQVWLI